MIRIFVIILASTLGYMLLGYLATKWSLSPMIASPIWPAAGLALALVYRFGDAAAVGTVLGALLLRPLISHQPAGAWNSELFLNFYLVEALAAGIQAWIGAQSLQKLIGGRSSLSTWREILCFYVVAGLIVSTISATITCANFVLFDRFPIATVWKIWLIFWSGDVLGVSLFAPLALLLLNYKDDLWKDRAWPLGTTLLLCICASIGAYGWIKDRESLSYIEHRQDLLDQSQRVMAARLQMIQELTKATAGFFASSELVTEQEFDLYSSNILLGQKYIQGAIWLPMSLLNSVVLHADAAQAEVLQPRKDSAGPLGLSVSAANRDQAYYSSLKSELGPLAPKIVKWVLGIEWDVQNRKGWHFFPADLDPSLAALSLVYRQIPAFASMPSGLLLIVVDMNQLLVDSGLFAAELTAVQFRLSKSDIGKFLNEQVFLATKDFSALRQSTNKGWEPFQRFPQEFQVATLVGNLRVLLEAYIMPDHTKVVYQTGTGWLALACAFFFSSLLGGLTLGLTGEKTRIEKLIVQKTRDLLAAKEDAERANLAKDELIAKISHDMRTPLNGIIAGSQILEQMVTEPEVKKYSSIIKQSSSTLLGLIDDVLDFARIRSGFIEIKFSRFSIKEILQELVVMLKSQSQFAGANISIDVDDGVPTALMGDEVKLRQIVVNLLSNACKFGLDKPIAVNVSWREQDEAEPSLILVVEDQGKGISPKNMTRIFSPFVQAADEFHKPQLGSGLGLTICKSLLDALGGRIMVQSREHFGAKFTVEFPCSKLEESLGASEHSEASPNLAPEKLSILVVEDDRINQIVLQKLLEMSGHEVQIADSGQLAIKDLQQGYRPDLIFLDCQMAGLDGYETARIIRSMGLSTYIVAVTAHAVQGERNRCLEAGMDNYLAKPVTGQHLKQIFVSFLAQRDSKDRPRGEI